MSHYVIFKPANKTLDEIWQYSAETWGEKQAEIYIEGLFGMLKQAASREVLWRRLHEQTFLEAYFVKYRYHYLFFRELDDNTIGVISTIHEQRDIASILNKDFNIPNT